MSMGAGAVSGGAMEHMRPLSTKGIRDATTSNGAQQLEGVRRSGALEFAITARPTWWNLYQGQRVAAWTYNGTMPGPTIRVRNGERVRIKFRNSLPDPTTVHWHGVDVPNSRDGVPGVTQKPIPPGGTFDYEFTARPAGDPRGGGTFLYHSHVDEDRQMPAGLYGALIIDPPGPKRDYVVDKTLQISEMAADAQTGRIRGAMPMEGMLPNFFTINGKSYPDTEPILVPAGEPVLLRLINSGQFAHPLHLHGTSFEVIARDGHRLATPERRDTLTLESGERADIVARLPKGKWLFHCHIGHHLTNDGAGNGGLMTVVEAA
jgi:FtsP/CotA-like multicopper oxidase with cupredoxin domain